MKKILLTFAMVVTIAMSAFTPVAVFADNGTAMNDQRADAKILSNCANAENNDGGGIMCLLETGKDILMAGVVVLGVLGISIAGIQYLTAGGDVGKTQKAKNRIFEIVIGVAVFAAIYAISSFFFLN